MTDKPISSSRGATGSENSSALTVGSTDPALDGGATGLDQSIPSSQSTSSAFDFESGSSTGGDTGGLTRQTGQEASSLKNKAVNRLHSEADARKSAVSDQLKEVSGALGSVSQNPGGGQTPQWLTNGVSQVTGYIDRIANQIETRDTAELVEDVKRYARSNPAVFLGACAVAGFAAARIFSAGAQGATVSGDGR